MISGALHSSYTRIIFCSTIYEIVYMPILKPNYCSEVTFYCTLRWYNNNPYPTISCRTIKIIVWMDFIVYIIVYTSHSNNLWHDSTGCSIQLWYFWYFSCQSCHKFLIHLILSIYKRCFIIIITRVMNPIVQCGL